MTKSDDIADGCSPEGLVGWGLIDGGCTANRPNHIRSVESPRIGFILGDRAVVMASYGSGLRGGATVPDEGTQATMRWVCGRSVVAPVMGALQRLREGSRGGGGFLG